MKTWKDAFQFFPIWGSRNIKEDFCLKTYSIIYLAVFFEEKEKKMGFVISENQLKHLGFPEKKKKNGISDISVRKKTFWWVSSDNSMERGFHMTDVQGTAPDSEEQITIYDIMMIS